MNTIMRKIQKILLSSMAHIHGGRSKQQKANPLAHAAVISEAVIKLGSNEICSFCRYCTATKARKAPSATTTARA